MKTKSSMQRQLQKVYRHKIELLKPMVDSTELVHKTSFVHYFYTHADVKNLHGKEYYEARQVGAENTVKFEIRMPAKVIDTDMRIRFKGKDYNIVFIDNVGFENERLEIKAEEVKYDKQNRA